MPKPIKNSKLPAEVNPLTEYLVNESVREGGVPDRKTDEQISLLVAETGRKGEKRRIEAMAAKERKSAASKAAKAVRKKGKKASRRG
jgi:topoisomerase IA-like protein